MENAVAFGDGVHAHFHHPFHADLFEMRGEQPAADAPIETETAAKDGFAGIETAVNINLLVDGGAVDAEFRAAHGRCFFHRGQDIASHLAAANCVEAQCRAGFSERRDQLVHEIIFGAVDHMGQANVGEDFLLRVGAHDGDQWHAFFQAKLGEHLSEIGSRCGVDQSFVAFRAHGVDKALRGHRIDEQRSAFLGRSAFG